MRGCACMRCIHWKDWTLDFMVVEQALKDAEPGVREHALILAEKYPQSIRQLLQMVNDPSIQVALQATLSLE